MGEAAKLGKDELQCVLSKLSFVDGLRFKRVCRWWRSVAESYASSDLYCRRFQSPWLVLPEAEKKGECRLSFYDLHEKKMYRHVCKMEEDNKGRCVGSSRGWLVFVDESANLSIFNPVSDTQILVGSLKEGLKFPPYHKYVFKTVVILSDSKFNKDEDRVVLIYGHRKKLAFCSCKGGTFMDLEGAHPPYDDIICKDNKVVCALSETGSVEMWDFNNGCFPAKINMDMTPPPQLRIRLLSVGNLTYHIIGRGLWYLVESGGEVLLVARMMGDYAIVDGVKFMAHVLPRTFLFHVYRLDRDEKRWVEMERLGDLVVFVGGNESISLRAGDCPGCVKNSIYFTDDDRWCRFRPPEDVGFYNMEDGSGKLFVQTLRGMRNPLPPIPFWILPVT